MSDVEYSGQHNTDVLVVGAGPAGIAAAVRASQAGCHVTVVDDNITPGGQIWRGRGGSSTDSTSASWFHRFNAAGVHPIAGVQVISADPATHTVLVESPENALEVHFGKLILATGARELFLPFPGWTLPGVFGVGGLQALVQSGLPIVGKKVVVAGSGPLLLAVAAHLQRRGAHIKLLAEQSSRSTLIGFGRTLVRHPGKLRQAAALRLSLLGVPYRFGCWVEAAEGASRIERLRIRQGRRTWTEECDYAAVAYGLCPNVELASLIGCDMEGNAIKVDESQRSSRPDVYCAGECTGIGGVDLALVEGEIAGLAASGQAKAAIALYSRRRSAARFGKALKKAFELRLELRDLPRSDTLVCRCEDVRFGHLSKFPSFRAAKLHTRCGMGPCQARVCGSAAEFLFGWRNESVRPPVFAARIGSLTTPAAIPHQES